MSRSVTFDCGCTLDERVPGARVEVRCALHKALAEVGRLRAALEAAKRGHECCCEWPHGEPKPEGAACSCGADAHNAAIDRALRGEP